MAVIAAAGLAIDAYVHFDLASAYAGVKSSVLSQADFFGAEATVAAIAAAAVLLRPRRYTAAFAFVVAAAGTAAVVPDGFAAVRLAGETRPNVVLMDLSMPGIDGVEATRQLLATAPDSKVVILTSFPEAERITAAVHAGAVHVFAAIGVTDRTSAAVWAQRNGLG